MHPIKRQRAIQRLSLRELARRSGVPAGTLSGIERGTREPQIVTLAKIADALGVDVEELIAPKVRTPPLSESPEFKARVEAASESGLWELYKELESERIDLGLAHHDHPDDPAIRTEFARVLERKMLVATRLAALNPERAQAVLAGAEVG